MSVASARIFLSAGEPSGDLHGAAVVRALRERLPHARTRCLRGAAHGRGRARAVLFPMEGFAAFGIVEVIEKVPAHYLLLASHGAPVRAHGATTSSSSSTIPGSTCTWPRRHAAPAFRCCTTSRRSSGPGGPQRAKRLAAACDRLAVILPFEEAFFRNVGVEARYVGHPLLDRGAPPTAGRGARVARHRRGRARAGTVPGKPGRGDQAAVAFAARGGAHAARPRASRRGCWSRRPARRRTRAMSDSRWCRGDSLAVLAAADAGIVKSGTSTLEAALTDTPMVVPYKVNAITAFLTRRLITVKWASLVNLVAEREVVPELLQEHLSAGALVEAVAPLLDPASAAARGAAPGPGAGARAARHAGRRRARGRHRHRAARRMKIRVSPGPAPCHRPPGHLGAGQHVALRVPAGDPAGDRSARRARDHRDRGVARGTAATPLARPGDGPRGGGERVAGRRVRRAGGGGVRLPAAPRFQQPSGRAGRCSRPYASCRRAPASPSRRTAPGVRGGYSSRGRRSRRSRRACPWSRSAPRRRRRGGSGRGTSSPSRSRVRGSGSPTVIPSRWGPVRRASRRRRRWRSGH